LFYTSFALHQSCAKLCVSKYVKENVSLKQCYKDCKKDMKDGSRLVAELADQVEYDSEADVSITCTQKCAEYYICLGKGALEGNTAQCTTPSGCVCNKFAWQKDSEMETSSDSAIANGATLRTTDASNIRSGPCTDQNRITTVPAGTTLKYTGQQKSGCGYTWYSVSGSFGNGWIASSLVQEVGGSSPSSGSFSVDTLKSVFPLLSAAKASEYFPFLRDAMNGGNINTCLRRSAFLAQLGHESGQLRWFEEFASGAAYEGRKDLGNIYPGDGVRYKGRGPIQLTGRANYRAAGQALGVDLEGNPTLAATKEWGFKIAVWFWNTRNLNSYADQGSQDAFDTITRRINGGLNGKADRDAYYWKFRRLLGCQAGTQ
jgi:predicted chitinase